jgi:hypothetical protein
MECVISPFVIVCTTADAYKKKEKNLKKNLILVIFE